MNLVLFEQMDAPVLRGNIEFFLRIIGWWMRSGSYRCIANGSSIARQRYD